MALDLILTQPQKPFKTADLSISEIFLINQGSSPNSYHEGIIVHKCSHCFLRLPVSCIRSDDFCLLHYFYLSLVFRIIFLAMDKGFHDNQIQDYPASFFFSFLSNIFFKFLLFLNKFCLIAPSDIF